MKTTHVIPQLALLGALAFGTACSSTSNMTDTAATGTTAGSSISTASDATSTDYSTSSGTVSSPGTSSTAAISGSGGGSSYAPLATGSDAATDMNAFMATFATMQDPVFLMSAASSNLLEIQLGQLAAQRASNAEVKRFGQMMADHHTKATQELKTIATPLGVTLPQTMMPVHQAMADRLMNKSGKEFDEAYMDLMETAHKMDIAMFEAKSNAAETASVKNFATKTLPLLRSHEKMANDLEKKVD